MGLVLTEGGAVVNAVPSPIVQLRETISLVQRQIEDASWNNLSQDDARRSLEDDSEDRRRLIERARLAVRRNPMARQAVDLLQHYVLGQGISVKAANRTIVAKLVDEFVQNTENRATLTSHAAQKEFLERLYVDGDVFLTLFVGKDDKEGLVRVGWIDALLVEDIIPDPNNRKIAKWLQVKGNTQTFNFASNQWEARVEDDYVYYRYWQNDDEPPTGMGAKLKEGLVYQTSVDKSGLFGRSKLATAIDWLKAHREFMEDRATLNRAAASVAWKKKRTGPASDIQREVDRLQSSIVGNPTRYEQNPARAAGSTVVENQGSSLEWVDTNTGGSSADYDERKLRMMAGSGMGGIPNHYFGDVADANLATATAMELPLLKAYEDMQETIRQVLTDIIKFYLTACNKAGRVGEDDREGEYAERTTTAQAVMDQPDQEGAPATTAKVVKTREALQLPYAPPPQPGVRMVPRPLDEAPEEPKEPGPDDPVSWFVDIGFPPIVQKELFTFMQALEKFAALLPTEVLDAKKLVVELGLAAFGVNDIDREMSRIYPADMVAVVVPTPPPPVPVEPGASPVHESSIADIRRRRLLSVVREAGAQYAGARTGTG